MSQQPSLLNRIARVLLCLVFIHAVVGQLTGFAGVAGAIAAKGLPLAPLLLVADQESGSEQGLSFPAGTAGGRGCRG